MLTILLKRVPWLVMLLLLMPAITCGGTMEWNNSVGGPWETVSNWKQDKLPSLGDDVLISGTGTGTITFGSTATIGTLKISANKLALVSGELIVSTATPPPPPQFNLSITKSGDGTGLVSSSPSGISCGSACSALFDSKRAVVLTAVADTGSVFSGWSNSGCPGTGTCNITIDKSDVGVIATFTKLATGPVSAFSISHSTPYVNQAIQFSDTSSGNPTSWDWDFGDGTTSSLQSPTHTYTSAGNYNVKLTAGNESGTNLSTKSITVTSTGSTFTLMSDVASSGGTLPIDYTIDGLGASPALSWVNPPNNTAQYVLMMTTQAVDGTLYNWVLYNVPAATTALTKSSTGVGTAGVIVGHTTSLPGYAPPQSPGGGDKVYTLTLYALSGAPDLTGDATGAALATAIASKTLGQASMNLTYSRTAPVAGFTYETVDSTVQFTSEGVSGLSTSSWLWEFDDKMTSTEQNPIHTFMSYGNHNVKLTVGNSIDGTAHTSSITKTITVTSSSTVNMGMVQTISDGAQRTTLAFSAFAMMNGNLNTQSFFPPGKVADYTGFQYLRDNDPGGQGHNTSFLTRVSENVLYKLTVAQLQKLNTMATAQKSQVSEYGYERFKFMEAFRRLMTGGTSIPTGSTGLDLDAVKSASKALYLIDGQISYDRAALYASILNSPDAADLKSYMDTQMKGNGLGGWADWPDTSVDPIKTAVSNKLKNYVSGDNMVAVMTYASDLYSWYEGSLAADVYFCPERQGTYYGGFYMKDAPAIGHEGYAISTTLTADAGEWLSNSTYGYVDATQAAKMAGLVDTQRNNLYAGSSSIVSIRLQIATLLRKLLTTTDPVEMASINNQVLALSGTYGELDGENNYNYAKVFAEVYQSLSQTQKDSLRTKYVEIMTGVYKNDAGVVIGTFDFSDISQAKLYLYSDILTGTEPQFKTNTSDAVIYPLFGATYTGQ